MGRHYMVYRNLYRKRQIYEIRFKFMEPDEYKACLPEDFDSEILAITPYHDTIYPINRKLICGLWLNQNGGHKAYEISFGCQNRKPEGSDEGKRGRIGF